MSASYVIMAAPSGLVDRRGALQRLQERFAHARHDSGVSYSRCVRLTELLTDSGQASKSVESLKPVIFFLVVGVVSEWVVGARSRIFLQWSVSVHQKPVA
ncbi:hypothetical protein ACEQ38_11655 [Ralstonia syzygii subsp. celebesensis]|uniref:hypothetical protein n=1 Tax=Ralstonia syzygii TaxID=28097 RepID=UPI00156082EE|nr:hypothetical protein [Ralstonia syzygii]